jgi:hypothetical protein
MRSIIATTPEQDRLEHQVESLNALDLPRLREAWPVRFGPVPKIRSASLLRRMLAWRLQAEALGGLDAETRRLLRRPAPSKGPRLAPGARLAREWQGERHEVEVLVKGVGYRGGVYASLSEVARTITGVRWNGPRFFGLRS